MTHVLQTLQYISLWFGGIVVQSKSPWHNINEKHVSHKPTTFIFLFHKSWNYYNSVLKRFIKRFSGISRHFVVDIWNIIWPTAFIFLFHKSWTYNHSVSKRFINSSSGLLRYFVVEMWNIIYLCRLLTTFYSVESQPIRKNSWSCGHSRDFWHRPKWTGSTQRAS